MSTKEQVRPNLLPIPVKKKLHPWNLLDLLIILWNNTCISFRYRFYLTFCNIPVLTENQPIQQIVLSVFWCWWYISNILSFLYKFCIERTIYIQILTCALLLCIADIFQFCLICDTWWFDQRLPIYRHSSQKVMIQFQHATARIDIILSGLTTKKWPWDYQ